MDAEMEQFCQDLLQSVHEMNTQVIAQKTEFQIQGNGTVFQRTIKADGTLKREFAGADGFMRTEENLLARNAARDLNAELLESIEQLKQGQLGRVSVAVNGKVIESPIAKVRVSACLTQSQFAKLLGVSVRTLQEWEQGRRSPSGAAKTLLKIAERHPEFLQELAD